MSSEIIPVSCDTEPTEERNECKHLDRSGYTFRGRYDKFGYKFCPKCGEKL